jgi:hypothetical protein
MWDIFENFFSYPLYQNIIAATLTPLQKEVIIDTLLGDASIERDKPTHNSRIRYDQTYPNHESYLLSIYEIFKKLVGTPPKIHIRQPNKRTNKIYSSIAFKTLRVKELNYYKELFYTYDPLGKKRKIVPNNISTLLTTRALAYWKMDDGSISTFKSAHLNTYNFTYEGIKILQDTLLI